MSGTFHLATGLLGVVFFFLAAYWIARSKHGVVLSCVALTLGAVLIGSLKLAAVGPTDGDPLSFAAGLLHALGIRGHALNGVRAIVSRKR